MADKTRRDFMKLAGATGATGALAGCSGGDNNGSSDSSSDGGSQETVSVNFWSATAAEGPDYRPFFEESLNNFEEKNSNITADMQLVSFGDVQQRLSAAVGGGNAPDMVEGGSAALPYFLNDEIPNHDPYIQETDLVDNWDQSMVDTAQFRGSYWSGGGARAGAPMLAIRPKFFRGFIDDPNEALATRTGFRRAVERVQQENQNIFAYEANATQNDLEYFWGKARSAYTDGTDPWLGGDPTSPEVRVTDDRTQGMIKDEIDMANAYSSSNASQRADEEQPGLMMTDRVAVAPSGGDFAPSFAQVSEDASFGWPDGDSYTILRPRLDPNYGNEFNIPELAGKEGQHGGHIFGFNPTKSLFASDVQDQAWELMLYTNKDPDHVIPLCAEIANAIPTYRGLRDEVQDRFDPVISGAEQVFNLRIRAFDEYGPSGQYSSTGASWDVQGTDAIRINAISGTMGEAIAGQIPRDNAATVMEDRINSILQEQNS